MTEAIGPATQLPLRISHRLKRRMISAVLCAAALLSTWPASAEDALPQSPEAMHAAFATAFNTKTLEPLLALYEANGILVPAPGKIAVGKEQVAEALRGFLALSGTMSIETVYIVPIGDDLAQLRSTWIVRDGDTVQVQGSGIEIAKRQPDGSWLFVLDNAFGGDPIANP